MTYDPIAALRASRADLLDAISKAGADVSRPNAIRCPFHEDTHPSSGVYLGDDGAWRFKCQSNHCGFAGDVFDVLARATGETVESQMSAIRKAQPPKPGKRPARRFSSVEAWRAAVPHSVKVYRYTDPDTGRADLLKLRAEPPGERKKFLQAHLDVDGTIVESAPPTPHPIYNRKRVRDAEQVMFVEGEKCVEALHAAGVVATCCPGGGGQGSASRADLSPLAGKAVILWPDHDAPDANGERGGHVHMREVADRLRELSPPPKLYWLDPERLGLGEKQDAADFVARFDAGGAADAVSDAIDLAVPLGGGAGAEVRDFIEEIIAGKVANVPTPFAGLTSLSRALLPGTVTILVGDPGTAKSFLVCQMLIDWHARGVPCAAYMLEDDRRFHMQRVLAQLAGDARLNDAEWVKAHPDESRAASDAHAGQLDAIGASVSDMPNATPNHADALTWIDRRAATARVVVVDPITAVDAGREPWETEKRFMADAKTILRRHGASLILVTHPRDGKNHGSLDQIAGSRVFPRFAQTVWWLKPAGKSRKRVVTDPMSKLDRAVNVDKELVVAKARNGRGQGVRFGYTFDPSSLLFNELGVIVAEGDEA